MILFASIASLVLALIPAAMFLRNLPLFCLAESAEDSSSEPAAVSVLIPARDEAVGIGACVSSALQSALEGDGIAVEVIVLDDHSSDGTGKIVQAIAAKDVRVRCLASDELPSGWNGKQFACYQLAAAAKHDFLVFLDADVRLNANALRRLVDEKRQRQAALLSQFPHQVTLTLAEKAFIPMMHYILLGYLPFARMRDSTHPAYASGCGQCFLTTKDEYQAAGTHESIKGSRHDGLKLPKAYRQAGLTTDVIDGTDLADCRMYDSTGQVINGVLKNATEGIAHPARIIPFSILLLGGSVLPVITLVWSVATQNAITLGISVCAIVAGHLPRAFGAIRFRQSWTGVFVHSIATLMFVVLQWIALLNQLRGKQVAWRGRT